MNKTELLRNKILASVILLLLAVNVFSQKSMDDKNPSTNQLKSMDLNLNQSKLDLQNMDILKQIEPQANSSTIYNDQLLEGAIDGNKYTVGPNDIFALGVWGIVNQPLPIAVSPEGSLIIPSVGE